jgi:hypothetical protein
LFEYEQGYFKALLDMSNFVDGHSVMINYQRQRKYRLLVNLIGYLLKNRDERELFMRYGGEVEVRINHEKDCKILEVRIG